MNYREALAALATRTNYETGGRLVAPTLERMRALVDLLANPERSAPAVHITGTNGKTTCARAAAEVLRAAGLTTGTYTSPHLVSHRERIVYDGELIPPAEFGATFEYLEPYLAEIDRTVGRVTWFETVTAMAFVWFADKAVDAQVVEVGLGGRWDATNVVDAPVAVITDVSLDHRELGATPREVAGEKAGIIKEGAVVLTAARDPDVLAAIEARCREVGADLRPPGDFFFTDELLLAVGGQRLAVRIAGRRYDDLFLPLYGRGLATDALLGAAAAAALLGDRELGDDVLAEAFAALRSPGRVEVLRRRPLLVLDGAHNPAAARELAETMRRSFVWDRLVLVAGMLADKDVPGTLEPLLALADEIVVAPVASPRGASAEGLIEAIERLGGKAMSAPSVSGALAVAMEHAGERDAVLVTGSLYTVGEARSHITGERE